MKRSNYRTAALLCALLLLPVSVVADEDTSSDRYAEEQTTEEVRQKRTDSEKQTREPREDRSRRTSPYAGTPSYAVGSANEASRYRTDQGWSRGRSNWWWGGSRGSDIPTTGYNRGGYRSKR